MHKKLKVLTQHNVLEAVQGTCLSQGIGDKSSQQHSFLLERGDTGGGIGKGERREKRRKTKVEEKRKGKSNTCNYKKQTEL